MGGTENLVMATFTLAKLNQNLLLLTERLRHKPTLVFLTYFCNTLFVIKENIICNPLNWPVRVCHKGIYALC